MVKVTVKKQDRITYDQLKSGDVFEWPTDYAEGKRARAIKTTDGFMWLKNSCEKTDWFHCGKDSESNFPVILLGKLTEIVVEK